MSLNLNWFKSYDTKYKYFQCLSSTKLRFKGILRCLTLISTKGMTQNTKMQKTQISVFVQNRQKTEMEIFVFCVITFEPIKI